MLSRSSHKSKLLVKSTGAEETLANGEAVDEVNVLRNALQNILGTKIHLWVAIDRKYIYASL